MYFWNRLLRALGFRVPLKRTYRLDEDLVQSLQTLAERERLSEEQVAANLISEAMVRRQAEQSILRRWRSLTPREQQVTALVCQNYTTGEIANYLVISHATVKSHVRNILIKFELEDRAELRLLLSDFDFGEW